MGTEKTPPDLLRHRCAATPTPTAPGRPASARLLLRTAQDTPRTSASYPVGRRPSTSRVATTRLARTNTPPAYAGRNHRHHDGCTCRRAPDGFHGHGRGGGGVERGESREAEADDDADARGVLVRDTGASAILLSSKHRADSMADEPREHQNRAYGRDRGQDVEPDRPADDRLDETQRDMRNSREVPVSKQRQAGHQSTADEGGRLCHTRRKQGAGKEECDGVSRERRNCRR